MPWTHWMQKIAVTALVLVAVFCGGVVAQDNIESKKIDFLISSVEHLTGAKFVRNNSEYDGKEAAAHLRMKLERASGRVQTAEDFIRLCASKSYSTGKPYTIRFSSGETMKSEEFFRKKLKQYTSVER